LRQEIDRERTRSEQRRIRERERERERKESRTLLRIIPHYTQQIYIVSFRVLFECTHKKNLDRSRSRLTGEREGEERERKRGENSKRSARYSNTALSLSLALHPPSLSIKKREGERSGVQEKSNRLYIEEKAVRIKRRQKEKGSEKMTKDMSPNTHQPHSLTAEGLLDNSI